MACVPTPTETVFADVFTTTVIQTVSESVTVLPPTVTTLTLVSQSCSPPRPDIVGDGCVQIQVTTTSTVNGEFLSSVARLQCLCILVICAFDGFLWCRYTP